MGGATGATGATVSWEWAGCVRGTGPGSVHGADGDSRDALPRWRSVLAVVARPDDESAFLGAVLSAFVDEGASAAVLCFTRGRAAALQVVSDDAHVVRAGELAQAALRLGVGDARLRRHAPGGLGAVSLSTLVGEIVDAAADVEADGILVLDAVTDDPDRARATEAALAAAAQLDVPVLGWTVSAEVAAVMCDELGVVLSGRSPHAAGLVEVAVDRSRQRDALTCHASQALPGRAHSRRIELTGDVEHLVWLRRGPAR